MEKEICRIIGEIVNIDPARISAASTWKQLGLDSVQCLEVVMEIEEQFGITITDEEGESFSSVADIIACIVGKKNDTEDTE